MRSDAVKIEKHHGKTKLLEGTAAPLLVYLSDCLPCSRTEIRDAPLLHLIVLLASFSMAWQTQQPQQRGIEQSNGDHALLACCSPVLVDFMLCFPFLEISLQLVRGICQIELRV